MERGVVPGPQGIRWHATCLICGGKEAKGRGGRRKDGKPGCGKKLDSSAKRDSEEGSVWCRECLVNCFSFLLLSRTRMLIVSINALQCLIVCVAAASCLHARSACLSHSRYSPPHLPAYSYRRLFGQRRNVWTDCTAVYRWNIYHPPAHWWRRYRSSIHRWR